MNENKSINLKDSKFQFEWQASTPEEQSLNSEKLIEGIDYLKSNFPAYKSISIFRNGRIVFERINPNPYESSVSKAIRKIMKSSFEIMKFPKGTFNENEDEKWNIRSATKTITAILIGIAIKEGFINSVEDNIEMFFHEYKHLQNYNEKTEISIKDLLTMKSGLSTIDRGIMPIKFMKSHDWVEYILSKPLQNQAGVTFDYNSANTHLLSAIITKTTGMNAAKFASKYLFTPLGITDFTWESDPKGNSFGSGNLLLKPKDFAKIGLLILQKGIWMGEEIIPQEWIKESLCRYHLWDYGFHYGYTWYIKDEINEINGKSYLTYSAAGAGGQKLLIIPEVNLILVANSCVDYYKDRSYFLNFMIPKFILPSIMDWDGIGGGI